MPAGQAIVLIGHSHLGPIRTALDKMELAASDNSTPADFFLHDVWIHKTDYADSAPGGGVIFNSDVLALIEQTVPRDRERHYVGVLGGNGHIILALTKHPRPFDFVLPERPDIPLDEAAELIPYELFLESLKPFMMPYVWQMIAFRQALGHTFTCIETPPPYEDDNYVMSHLGAYVPDSRNIVSKHLRYKIWRAHSDLLRFFCRHNDIHFLEAPPEALEGIGFMSREGYGSDATHANPWYGGLVIKQLEKFYGVAYRKHLVFS